MAWSHPSRLHSLSQACRAHVPPDCGEGVSPLDQIRSLPEPALGHLGHEPGHVSPGRAVQTTGLQAFPLFDRAFQPPFALCTRLPKLALERLFFWNSLTPISRGCRPPRRCNLRATTCAKKRDKILDLRAQVKILSPLHIGRRGDCFPYRVAHPSPREQGESENRDLHYDKYSICTFSTMSLGRSRQSLGRFRTVVDGYPWPDLRFGYGVFWDGGRRSGCWAKNRR